MKTFKKLAGIILAAALVLSVPSAVWAAPLEPLLDETGSMAGEEISQDRSIVESAYGLADDGKGPDEAVEGESGGDESEGGESDGGESGGAPGGSEGGESGNEQQSLSPTEGPHIIKDEPVITTGDTYGYKGTFDADSASAEAININNESKTIDGRQILYWEQSAVQNNGTGVFVARNSYIRGETDLDTEPLAGNPGNLLVAGNIRTTLGLGNSQSFYINSTIVSRNWAALSTDGAEPAPEGGKELSLYAYGTDAITIDGGYGAYSDLFCNLYSYGSHIQSGEIGIISGTYGKVVIGTIEDGEKNEAFSEVLTGADMNKRPDKQLGSVIEGGRNAIMIHSVNLPPYWEYEGYEQDVLPLLHTFVSAKDSVLRTDLTLDRGIEYEAQKQAYIDHTKGSVILIKSTNVELDLDSCEMIPADGGTGYLIQTVYNNDTMFMNAVPDGEQYPGIMASMKNMDVKGDIAHEDYQRDLYLTLQATALEGRINEYDCAHWNEVSAAEGFTDYCLDSSYSTHHGVQVTLTEGSVWNVTQDSVLSRLMFTEGCTVNGDIYINGEKQVNKPGTFEGYVLVTPAKGSAEQTIVEIKSEPATEAATTPATETTGGYFEGAPYHEHTWVRDDGGNPATCTKEGGIPYVCAVCGEPKVESIPALGHDYILTGSTAPTCEDPGYMYYKCSRCGDEYTDTLPANGHSWVALYYQPATCTLYGYTEWECNVCHETDIEYIAAIGHNYQPVSYYILDSIEHETTYQCTNCMDTYSVDELHTGYDPCVCGYSGPVG